MSEDNFVETAKTAAHVRIEAMLDTIKEKEKMLAILAEKQDGKLSELSEKELQKRIAALES